MYRRCANGGLAASLALVAALTLAACGSAPEISDAPAQPAPEPEPPAAETFPLEGSVRAPQAAPATPPTAASEPATQAKSTAAPRPSASTDPNIPAGPAEPPLPPEAVQQFDNAVAMVNAGNVAAAEGAFRSLASAYPSYSGPLVNLGILHAKAGRLDEAEKALKGALERKADSATAYNQLGIVYRRQGRFKEADEAYTRAVQIDPSYANAYLNLGVLCDLYLQQPERALEAFERYLSLASAPDEKVSAWVKELKVRLGTAQRPAGAG
jgi:tetratricopeptide (TPR) repeat protein